MWLRDQVRARGLGTEQFRGSTVANEQGTELRV